MYSTVSSLFSHGNLRREWFQGREYLVAPLTMIVPGVLNGSNGPLLYPPDEIAEDVARWNGIPIVVNHPQDTGTPVSARQASVLESSGVGTIFNAHIRDSKLRAEGWFDVRRLKDIEPRILRWLENGTPVEVSTGLNIRWHRRKGTHNGRKYHGVVNHLEPDHLALLPDGAGACSVKDGCGIHVNSPREKALTPEEKDWLFTWYSDHLEHQKKHATANRQWTLTDDDLLIPPTLDFAKDCGCSQR